MKTEDISFRTTNTNSSRILDKGFVPSALVFGEFPNMRTFEGLIIPRTILAELPEVSVKDCRYVALHFARKNPARLTTLHTPATYRGYTRMVREESKESHWRMDRTVYCD